MKFLVFFALMVGLMGCEVQTDYRPVVFEKGYAIGLGVAHCVLYDRIGEFARYLVEEEEEATKRLCAARDALVSGPMNCKQLKAVMSGQGGV
jgi:hypothetical protein